MKVQTKITLLLLAVVATFLAGLAAFRAYDRIKFRKIADERFEQRQRSFKKFLDKHGEKLETLALDDSASDQMVEAIGVNDLQWFKDNVSIARLESFGANAVWIYRADGSPMYQVNDLSSDDLPPIPIPPGSFSKLFEKQPVPRFFFAVPQGTLEVRAAEIHRSKDF